jgi:hypothetical protein
MWGDVPKGAMTTYYITDFKEQVDWAFDKAIRKIENAGNIVFGNEGDGTILNASTQKWYEKNMDTDW